MKKVPISWSVFESSQRTMSLAADLEGSGRIPLNFSSTEGARAALTWDFPTVSEASPGPYPSEEREDCWGHIYQLSGCHQNNTKWSKRNQNVGREGSCQERLTHTYRCTYGEREFSWMYSLSTALHEWGDMDTRVIPQIAEVFLSFMAPSERAEYAPLSHLQWV